MPRIIALLLLSFSTSGEERVVTAIPALEAIGKELLVGTGIEIINPVGSDVPLQELEGTIKEMREHLDSLSETVTASTSTILVKSGSH